MYPRLFLEQAGDAWHQALPRAVQSIIVSQGLFDVSLVAHFGLGLSVPKVPRDLAWEPQP